MKKMKGNKYLQLQTISGTTNSIGEKVLTYTNYLPPFLGWFDLNSGDTKYITYNAAVTESTHVFLCDYDANNVITESAKNLSCLIDNIRYDVTYVDEPMGLNYHYEIFLRRVD